MHYVLRFGVHVGQSAGLPHECTCAGRSGMVLVQGCGNPEKGLDKRNEVVGV